MLEEDSDAGIRLEEHLLYCPKCLGRAEETAAYVDAIRAAIIAMNYDLMI
jgi:hypothetical protein